MSDTDIPMSIKMTGACFPSIIELKNGRAADEKEIENILGFIDLRLDCADFRMICILRALSDFSDNLSESIKQKMKKSVLGFKYWMDEPGADSMCYWSENHQLIFATVEYIAGTMYENERFTNNGMTGKEHAEKGLKRIRRWMERRFQYGFVEWLSNTYYEEDIAPLSLLSDLARDKDVRTMAEMALDLLFADIAMHSFGYSFGASSGRCYEMQKKYPEKQDTRDLTAWAFGAENWQFDYKRISTDLHLNRTYQVPEVIKSIFHDKSENYTECTHGLDLKELDYEFRNRDRIEDKGAFSWAMESFSNPETIQTTMRMYKLYRMDRNIFLQDLKCISAPILEKLHLLPFLVRLMNPITQGVAIQRANTATLRRPEYMLSTAQMYHPGEYGDQQHIWQASMKGGISVFTTHPAVSAFDDNARNFSPGYWVGNGKLPASIQDRNINLTLYDLTGRKGMMEKTRQMQSHLFFPFDKFDKWELRDSNRVLIGRKDDGYIALLSVHPMKKGEESELIQKGRRNGWACIMGSQTDYNRFSDFANYIETLSLRLKRGTLTLFEGAKERMAVSASRARIGKRKPDFNYPRLRSTYGNIGRNPEIWEIAHGSSSLKLNFKTFTIEETEQ